MRDLIPEFIAVWTIDFAWSLFVLMFAIKYYKLGVYEFYHNFIIIFLLLTYYIRVFEIILLITEKQDQKFNRDFGHYDRLEFLLVYTPLLFQGLTGLAYLFRWSSYLVLTTAKNELDEKDIIK